MNDRSFLIVEKNVIRRRRRLNALAGAQVGGLITMSLTLAHLAAVFLGSMPMIQPWWWLIVGNLAGLLVGAQLGRRREVPVQRDLYRLDRSYALGEKLSTIHEIRKRDDHSPYLRLLYQRIGDRDLSPHRALRPSQRQRRGWAALGGVTTASIALLFMWFVGIPPLSVSTLLASNASEQPFVTSQNETSAASASPSPQASSPSSPRETPGADEERTADPCSDGGSSSPSLLSRDSRADCEDASRSSSNSSDSSTESQPSSESASEDARMSVQQLRRQLENMQQRVASGHLSNEDAQRELEQLAQEARSPSLEELLQQAAQSQTLDELRQRLQDALDELDRQREQAQQGSGRRGLDPDADIQRRSNQRSNGSQQGQTEGQSQPSDDGSSGEGPELSERSGEGQPQNQPGEGPQRSRSGSGANEGDEGSGSQDAQQGTASESGDQGSAEEGQGEAESGQGESGEQASSGSQQDSQAGDTQSEGQSGGGDDASGSNSDSSTDGEDTERSDNARLDSQSQGEREGAGSPGGSSPGTGPGGGREDPSGNADGDTTNDLRIQSPDLPQDIDTLRALMTRGVPFDVSGSPAPDGTPQLELNPDRVETLLRSRDLPPEVRDLVRAYFLSLAEGE